MGYVITREEPLLIYGGGLVGCTLCDRMMRAGYNVVAIIDRAPEKVTGAPVPVHTAATCHEKYGNAFVYVSLRSGTDHMEVARCLRNAGFERILFLPLFLRSAAAAKMTDVWNDFFEGNYGGGIPCHVDLFTVDPNDYILRRTREFVTVIVHKDHICTTKEERDADNPYAIHCSEMSYSDKVEIERAKKHGVLDAPIVSDRVRKFAILDDNTNKKRKGLLNSTLFDMNGFYIHAPSIAAYDREKGYFNLMDGMHRAVFLVGRGFTGVPLKVKESEYLEYFRRDEAQALMDYCRDLDSLPREVKHPAFVWLPVCERAADSEFTRLYERTFNGMD
ncbi:MAG: hypothetical protein LBI62_01530 [Candidatus Accumulibacter sp.]|jgi:hypothetical protein|nr:hypothetical protein [Accumulibacter sp.]